jgi:hypothetical protein
MSHVTKYERVPLHQHVREGGTCEYPHHLNSDWKDEGSRD